MKSLVQHLIILAAQFSLDMNLSVTRHEGTDEIVSL